jgi:dihydropteroate synthase
LYSNVTREVLDHLVLRMQQIKEAGIRDIIIDPGFGFGKTIEHNFSLLRELSVFSLLKAPLLLGISRKSFIWKTLETTPESDAALQGTTALHMAGLMNGASILRVHDVKEAVDTIRLFNDMQMSGK